MVIEFLIIILSSVTFWDRKKKQVSVNLMIIKIQKAII